MKIKIRPATKKGYIECCQWGCFDVSYPNSTKRRGRVQGGGNICPTLTTEPMIVVFEGLEDEKQRINEQINANSKMEQF